MSRQKTLSYLFGCEVIRFRFWGAVVARGSACAPAIRLPQNMGTPLCHRQEYNHRKNLQWCQQRRSIGSDLFCLFSGRPRHIGLKDLSKSKYGLFQLAFRSNRVLNRECERIIKKDRIPYGRRSLQLAAGIFKNKHQAVSQGVRRFGKRSIFGHM